MKMLAGQVAPAGKACRSERLWRQHQGWRSHGIAVVQGRRRARGEASRPASSLDNVYITDWKPRFGFSWPAGSLGAR